METSLATYSIAADTDPDPDTESNSDNKQSHKPTLIQPNVLDPISAKMKVSE